MDRQLSAAELARHAGVDVSFVSRAVASGALGRGDESGFAPADAAKCCFLEAWDAAGLRVETVGELVQSGEIPFSFLGAPFLSVEDVLPLTYAELSADAGVHMETIQALHEAIGFEPPAPEDAAREDDRNLLDWWQTMSAAGFSTEAVLSLARVYSAALRRMTIAEAEGYEAEIEDQRRRSGASEQDLMEMGGQMGRRLPGLFEQTIFDMYRRHRRHVWLDHSASHVEIILESKGLFERLDRPPCVCFVDLTGFTRLTEERGDRTAAEVARSLEAIVERISHRYSGRPVRWLGDGGMFVFQDPLAAVDAATAMLTEASNSNLPPTHIGIHCGPVIFQDGDIYGRTVNIASRLSSHATGGEILVSSAMAERVGDERNFEPVGPIDLKGVAEPVVVCRVQTDFTPPAPNQKRAPRNSR